MASNKTTLNLSYTTKALLDISKSLATITNQLSTLSNSVNNSLNDSLKNSNKEAESLKKNFKEMVSMKTPFTSAFFKNLDTSLIGKNKIGNTLIETQNNLSELFSSEEYQKRYSKYKTSKEKIKNSGVSKDLMRERLKANKKEFTSDKTGKQILMESLGTITSTIVTSTINTSEKILNEAKKMINEVSTYAISTSYKVNSSARNQMLEYGLSESQNYAFTQVKSIMGISSDEDLFWMNDNQRQMFSRLMSKEMEIYDKMTSNGTLEGFQEMQIDLQLLKQEFYANVVQFIAQNKDLIITTIQTGTNALLSIMNLVSTISNAISKINPFSYNGALGGNRTITLNNYVSTTNQNAEQIANETTSKTISQLMTYANS